jgi:hypothetical protein
MKRHCLTAAKAREEPIIAAANKKTGSKFHALPFDLVRSGYVPKNGTVV